MRIISQDGMKDVPLKEKPGLNRYDRADDELTVSLPELEFTEWDSPLFEKWGGIRA